jgi:hypothetical protein
MEFVCPDPNATVRAANVRATIEAFDIAPNMAKRMIEKHQLAANDLRADNFVLVQRWLDALKSIQQQFGDVLLHQTGTRIIENADFPPHFQDAETVLLALDDIYHLNHRGEVGHYKCTRTSEGSIEVRCETPYPRQFERGLVEGITRNPRLTDNGKRRYHVQYKDAPPGQELTCTMIVQRSGAR